MPSFCNYSLCLWRWPRGDGEGNTILVGLEGPRCPPTTRAKHLPGIHLSKCQPWHQPNHSRQALQNHHVLIPVRPLPSLQQRWGLAGCQPRKNGLFCSASFLLNAGNNRSSHCQEGRSSACTVCMEKRQHKEACVCLL